MTIRASCLEKVARELWAIIAFALPVSAWAQTAQLESATIANGGGTSMAGVHTLTGTIGQANTSRLTSRDFTLDGGTWSIIAAIQEPGAPPLSVRYTQTNTVVVSWPITWPGFELIENADLNTSTWTKVSVAATELVVGKDRVAKEVLFPAPNGNRFFRLKGP